MSTLKDEIIKVGKHDATIAAYLALWNQSDIPYNEMLEMLVLNLQSEKDEMKQKHFPCGLEKVPRTPENWIRPILETKPDGTLETDEEAWARITKKLRPLLQSEKVDYNAKILAEIDKMNRKAFNG